MYQNEIRKLILNYGRLLLLNLLRLISLLYNSFLNFPGFGDESLQISPEFIIAEPILVAVRLSFR